MLFQDDVLIDSQSSYFATPLENPLLLTENLSEEAGKSKIKFVNPSKGKLFSNIAIKDVVIVDEASKIVTFQSLNNNVIDMSNLSDGHYLLCYFINGRYKTTRIILRKN